MVTTVNSTEPKELYTFVQANPAKVSNRFPGGKLRQNNMNIIADINEYSSEEDRPILLWLFSRYYMRSQWEFVATCNFVRYGTASYQVNRVWSPTEEGRILYA